MSDRKFAMTRKDVDFIWKQKGRPRRRKGEKESKGKRKEKSREAFAWLSCKVVLVCDPRSRPEVESDS